ncbi:YeeE/YedE family protein [Jiella mangrovi]|uniref:YeeE/YedE family protein n=1 Tax=Jiella mangrovi TaxID=2821407 RepID=A0ABS4BJF0_9HYPH|nr:YeeE/YedE thiosulfate transporter family protein [Jiella mangrovi]MBP0616892.1 YeeE/YedE family protein [Jiella mangrovi]
MPIEIATPFTPIASTIGGIMIGLSAVLVMALFGRIAGISGITTGALPMRRDDWSWRFAFVAGLIAAPLLVQAVTGSPVVQTVPGNLAAMALAGLFVGFGTVKGAGCTSGHGVCGLARLSGRSLAAVTIFMATAFATVFILRHIL